MNAFKESLELVADVAALCNEESPAPQRALKVLQRIQRTIPFEAGVLVAFDPITKRHVTVANLGYSESVLEYMSADFVDGDPAYLSMRNRSAGPLRWCDVPNYRSMYTANEVLMPAGFQEGASTCLFSPDGRYVGGFHHNTDVNRHTSDVGVEQMVALRRVLTPLVDAMRPPDDLSWTSLTEGAEEVALRTAGGELADLSGFPRDNCLADGSALATVLAQHEPPARFFWVCPDRFVNEVRCTTVRAGTVVAVRHREAPRNLSGRQLQILTLLATGLTNVEIAAHLCISPRTVATHVEHILRKLECAARGEASVRAVVEGIIPGVGTGLAKTLVPR